MKLILCSNHTLGSYTLRAVMWSRYSHSAVYDDATGLVYDSTLLQGGVKSSPWFDWAEHYPNREVRELNIIDVDGARAWLDAQVGKPYDWTALAGMVVHRNWQEDDAWFCSELAEACITLFGVPRFRASMSLITPRHQDMLADWRIGDVAPGVH